MTARRAGCQDASTPQKVQEEPGTVRKGISLPSHGRARGVTSASFPGSAGFCAAFSLVQDLPPVGDTDQAGRAASVRNGVSVLSPPTRRPGCSRPACLVTEDDRTVPGRQEESMKLE